MKSILKKCLATSLLLCLLAGSALADGISLTGTVVCDTPLTQRSAIGGTVAAVNVHEGDHVRAGDILATLETEKVYAEQDGTVRYFGSVGENAETVANRYGAVAYIEPKVLYTVSGSTRNAYDSEENRIIHPGEPVWLSVSSTGHTGTGVVTSVSGSSYTVEVLSGNLISGENAMIYRSEAMESTSKIGKGSTSLASYAAYSGTGLIASFAAENGAEVKAGDLLFETVSGTRADNAAELTVIRAGTDGVIASLSVSAGAELSSGGTVCEIRPDDGMRVQASACESDLENLNPGDAVTVEFTYLQNGEFTVPGTVERVSLLGTEAAGDGEEATFTVTVKLNDIAGVYYGLTAIVTTPEEEIAEAAEEKEEPAAEATSEEPDATSGATPQGFGGERPEGFPEGFSEGFPEGLPEGFPEGFPGAPGQMNTDPTEAPNG